MAVKSAILAVSDEAIPLTDAGTGDQRPGQSIAVRNLGAVRVHVGGADVVATLTADPNGGFPIEPGETMPFDLTSSDSILYACVADGASGLVAVIREGV